MGNKSIWGFILICILLSTSTVSASNRIFLDSFNYNLPHNNATNNIVDDSGSNYAVYHQEPFPKGFMDIQHVYFTVSGLNLTMKMKMGASPILNKTIQYEFNAELQLNNTLTIYIFSDKYVGETNTSQYEILVTNIENKVVINYLDQTENTITLIAGNYIYWILDLTQLNNVIPVNRIFLKDTLFNQINKKYQINPKFDGFVRNNYHSFGTHSSYVIDQFYINENYNLALNKFFWPFILVSLVILVLILYYYPKFKHKNNTLVSSK